MQKIYLLCSFYDFFNYNQLTHFAFKTKKPDFVKIMNIIFEELKASGNLPSPSGVAKEIMRLTQNSNVTIEELVHQVKVDPALTGQLLKIANSAFSGRSEPVIAVKDAVIRLGSKILSRLALSLSVLDSNRMGRCAAFDYDSFWSTSLLRGLAMQAISVHQRTIAPEEAFTVGLISEIGRLALAQIYPLEYSHCLESDSENLLIHEQIAFAIDHNKITLAILEDWGLPETVIDAVQIFQQFDPQTCFHNHPSEKLAAQLQLASLLADDQNLNLNFLSIQSLLNRFDINSLQFNVLKKQLLSDWYEWGELLSIPVSKTQESVKENDQLQTITLAHNEKSGLSILLIEDDRIQLEILSSYLSNQGHHITTAQNGEQALKSLLTSTPQIIITDYKMAPMDGLTLCKTLRANSQTQHIYLILITADKDMTTMTEAFAVGANDFIRKPITHNELNARILGAQRTIHLQTENNIRQKGIQRLAFDLAATKRRLEMVAATDQLTSLPNRRHAITILTQEWQKYRRHNRPLSLLSLDLDLFKQINDNFGHATGDMVLIHFANILRQSIRAGDTACRIGGEEFLVILPDTDLQTLRILSERIRNMVENNQPEQLYLSRLVTVSIGAAVADLKVDENGWENTLNRSDQALYSAKTSGRNRVKIFEDLPSDAPLKTKS